MSSETETSSDESESSHFSLDVGVEPEDDGAWGTGGGGKKRGPGTAVSCIDHCTSRTSNMVVPTLSLCVATEHGTDFNAKELAKKQDQSRLSIQSAAAGPVYTQQKQQSTSKKDEVRESISYSDNRDFHRTASTVSRTSNIQSKKAHKKRMQNMDDRLSQLSMKTSNRKLNKIGSYTNFNKNNQAGRAQNNQLSDDYQKQKLLEEQQEQQKIIIKTFVISVLLVIIPIGPNTLKETQTGFIKLLIKIIASIRLIALVLIIVIVITHWHKIEPAITKILDGETQSGNHGSKKTHKGNNTAVRQSLTNATSVASFMAQSALSAFVEEAPQTKKKKKKNKKDKKGGISKSQSVYSRAQVGGKRSQIGVSRSRL